jgi:predicted Fe-S protein YdhL (DUF1289 family)
MAPPGDGEPAPPSPCIGICLIDPGSRQCRGCLRSIAEIAIWCEASAAEKRTILARIAARRAAETPASCRGG